MVDADETIRRSAHHLLGCQGATVETARDAHEAIALARQTPYSAALVDIRLPDLDGFETYKRLREVQPGVPIILMTGFGWDPSHSIVKARQEGLQTVLYKPFRADRLLEAVEQALRPLPPADAATTAPAPPPPSGGPAPSPPAAAATAPGRRTVADANRPPRPLLMSLDRLLLVPIAVGHARALRPAWSTSSTRSDTRNGRWSRSSSALLAVLRSIAAALAWEAWQRPVPRVAVARRSSTPSPAWSMGLVDLPGVDGLPPLPARPRGDRSSASRARPGRERRGATR